MLEIAGELMLCLVKLHGNVVVPLVRYIPFIVLISIFYIFISMSVFLVPDRIDILQAHRITAVALHLGVLQDIVFFLREAL